jgi:hypothetical protein
LFNSGFPFRCVTGEGGGGALKAFTDYNHGKHRIHGIFKSSFPCVQRFPWLFNSGFPFRCVTGEGGGGALKAFTDYNHGKHRTHGIFNLIP